MTADQPSHELRPSSTRVIRGTTNVVQTEVRFFHSTKNKADTYMNYTRPPLTITFEPIKKAFLYAKNREVHLRYLTEITKDNQKCNEITTSNRRNKLRAIPCS